MHEETSKPQREIGLFSIYNNSPSERESGREALPSSFLFRHSQSSCRHLVYSSELNKSTVEQECKGVLQSGVYLLYKCALRDFARIRSYFSLYFVKSSHNPPAGRCHLYLKHYRPLSLLSNGNRGLFSRG